MLTLGDGRGGKRVAPSWEIGLMAGCEGLMLVLKFEMIEGAQMKFPVLEYLADVEELIFEGGGFMQNRTIYYRT